MVDNLIAQSICTHYSSLSGQPDIILGSGTKKSVQNMGCKKQGAKVGSLLLKKKKRQPGILFLDKNYPVFCTLLVATHIFGPDFFSESQTEPFFSTRIVGPD